MPILKRSPIKNFNGRVAKLEFFFFKIFFFNVALFPSTTMLIIFSKS